MVVLSRWEQPQYLRTLARIMAIDTSSTATLYVRSLSPPGGRPQLEDVMERLDALEASGAVDV